MVGRQNLDKSINIVNSVALYFFKQIKCLAKKVAFFSLRECVYIKICTEIMTHKMEIVFNKHFVNILLM